MDLIDQRTEREHIDRLRRSLEGVASKTPQDQQILVEFGTRNEVEVAIITVKSGAKNALSGRMISQLTEALDQVDLWLDKDQDRDDVARCLLIKGFGSTFCSGSDLIAARETANQTAGLALAQVMQFNMMRIQRLPIISICHLEGYALGGGAELALASDFRLMSASARIGFIHCRVGVCAGWGGGSRLVELVGPARGLELLASGRLIKSDEAVRIGLAEQVVGDEHELDKFIRSHSIRSKRTSRALKLMVNGARCLPFQQSLLAESHLFASTWGRAAHVRALDENMKHNDDHDDDEDVRTESKRTASSAREQQEQLEQPPSV